MYLSPVWLYDHDMIMSKPPSSSFAGGVEALWPPLLLGPLGRGRALRRAAHPQLQAAAGALKAAAAARGGDLEHIKLL